MDGIMRNYHTIDCDFSRKTPSFGENFNILTTKYVGSAVSDGGGSWCERSDTLSTFLFDNEVRSFGNNLKYFNSFILYSVRTTL